MSPLTITDTMQAEPEIPVISTAAAVSLLVRPQIIPENLPDTTLDCLHPRLRPPFLHIVNNSTLFTALPRCAISYPWTDKIGDCVVYCVLRDDLLPSLACRQRQSY